MRTSTATAPLSQARGGIAPHEGPQAGAVPLGPVRARVPQPGRTGRLVRAVVWNPVAAQEVRLRVRGWRALVTLTTSLAVIGVVGWVAYRDNVVPYGSVIGLAAAGSAVFRALAVALMATIALVVPSLAGPSISGERERRTLDLLLTTLLGPARIAAGKLLSTLSFAGLLVVACLPLFAGTYLLGGVTPGVVLETVALMAVGGLTVGSVSLFASALSRQVSAATVASYLAMAALIVVPLAGAFAVGSTQGDAAQDGPPPFSFAYTSGAAGLVSSISPGAGAAALLDSSDCSVMTPFFGSGLTVTNVMPCGPGDQYLVGLGPLGNWQLWEVTLMMDGATSAAAFAGCVVALRRRAAGAFG
jgi:ABC-2 type transport system permease protein